jgi:Ca-activated chloride channel homolog
LIDWTGEKSLLQKEMDEMFIEDGQTAFIDALYLAAEHILGKAKDNPNKKYALFFVTDCDDRASVYKVDAALKLLAGTDIQVFILGLSEGLDRSAGQKAFNLANKVAFETGGKAYFPRNSTNNEELIATVKLLLDELNSQYVIGYTSTNPQRKNKERKLNIEVVSDKDGEKVLAFSRNSFFINEK